ncbi:leucine-rich repeat-containing protein 9 isoform X2 [Anguilla anguilla]|uniref:leucine-rich repeat-containing protein 9 isoform X2 n=1 Tax=Anguilla anguilla TaxID=7936 RepID=UPI0015ACC9E0|nr:leucine-rich repeat-containing protein 9 isoform X2 [Anguilla anguilla]
MTQSEKQKPTSDEEVIKELCISNGISYEKVSQDGSNIRSLEMFFSGYPRMVGLSLFPRLSQLIVVGQSVSHIEGLEFCPLLQELWVVECQLTNVSGLQTCRQLQKLYIYDNKISKIENLEMLDSLEVLWINSNCITLIEGLDTLLNLRELNLADNAIERIGHGLDCNSGLENLNLSGNKISSFKELTHLARLPSLTSLGLKDPQSVPNPVCLLCNYATHVLYHMPGLQRLDTYYVSNRQIKDTAESTVMKKMMYYNMRVKSAQRQLAKTQAKLLEHKKKLMKLPEERIRAFSYALKQLEGELAEVQMHRKSARTWETGPSSQAEEASESDAAPDDITRDPRLEYKLHCKLGAVKERLRVWMQRLEDIETHHQQSLTLATERKELMVHFLLMELETVGNIRFEEGSPSDPWFSSCYDLVLSRFCVWDFSGHGITGIKINGIIRIHNRALRLRFEDKLHVLLASDESTIFSQTRVVVSADAVKDASALERSSDLPLPSSFPRRNYKRWLEYLFYVYDPERTDGNEFLHIPEEGFRTADGYKALGRERAVPLSNSLSVCEKLRMEYALKQARARGRRCGDSLPFRHGQILVAKVFLGRSTSAREGVEVDPEKYSKVHSVFRSARKDSEKLCSAKHHNSCECSLRQCQWYVFDHELVLPEYLIDFDYVTQDRNQCGFLEQKPSSNTEVSAQCSPDASLDEEALGMEPVLQPRPKMPSLDEKALLAVARANVLSQITVLNLHGNSLSRLKEISRLTALRRLTVSFNELTHLDDISHMPNLEFVDASHNRLVTLEGLRGLGRLKQLDLRWNQLSRTREETSVLRKHAPALLRLHIRHNPWLKPGTVRTTVLGRLKTLTHLDDQLVTEEEAAAAVQIAADSRINQAALLAHSRTDPDRPRSLSLLSAAQLLTQLSPNPWDLSGLLEPGWTSKITALNLDGQRLSRLTNLDKLVNLRWASFNNNDITKAEGLDSCQHLEELSLNDNYISRMDGVSKLHRLTRLSMNGNQLTSLDGGVLDRLPNLHFLSLENNGISSLQGVQRARSLFEFYIGNNRISTTRDVYHLKSLTNLIILDLYGNPLVEKQENYRIYVVFHLPSLKALDGVAVTSECENAKDVFGGRLTLDMVTEKLGHSNYSDISQLDVQSSSIRTVDLTPGDLFSNLQHVNLERNNLTSFSGLVYLPKIKALHLNYNHIESILPRQKAQAQAHLTNRQILYHKVISSGYGQQAMSKGSRDAGPGDSLEPLMTNLEVLHLSHNGISNLANLQLSRLTNLKALFLQANEITQVEGLEGLLQLRELALDRNRIKALGETSFSGQGVLLELHLTENRLRELSNLHPLGQLRRLFLGVNKLQDLSEIDKLEALPSLTELSVVGNPVARRSQHRSSVVLRLSRLQVLDGTAVTLEERTRAELAYAETQCSLPTSAAPEANVPCLLPFMPRGVPLRSTTIALPHLLGQDGQLPFGLEEAPLSDPPRHKANGRQKQNGGFIPPQCRSGPPEMAFRQLRGVVALPTTCLLPNGHRVVIPYPHQQEQDGRCQSASKPPSM